MTSQKIELVQTGFKKVVVSTALAAAMSDA
jgi:hypothetical protein